MVKKLKNAILFFLFALLTCALTFFIYAFNPLKDTCFAEANTYDETDFTVDLNPQSYEYNAEPHDYIVTILYKGENFSDYIVNYFEIGNTDFLDSTPVQANNYGVEIYVNETIKWFTSLTITPKPITINYAGPHEYSYSGLKHGRTITAVGVISPDDVGMQIEYEGVTNLMPVNEIPVNVDEYLITVTLTNQNYVIGSIIGEETGKLTIKKTDLTVRAEDIIIQPGETPNFKLLYSGFVLGDDETCLKPAPSMSFEEKTPGKYYKAPSGGSSPNYNFIYEESSIIINLDKIETKAQDHSFTLIAFLDPDFDFKVTKITSSDEPFKKANETIRARGMDTYMDKVIYAFDTSQSVRVSRDTKYKIQISDIQLNNIFAYKLFIVDELGLVHEIRKFSRSGDTISFTSPELGTIFVVEMQLRTYLIIGISVGVVLIIIAFFVFTYVKFVMEKKNLSEQNRRRRNKTEYKWD